jgi:hypothetical protein
VQRHGRNTARGDPKPPPGRVPDPRQGYRGRAPHPIGHPRVEIDHDGQKADTVLKDWQLLEKLNGLVGGQGFRATASAPPCDADRVQQALDRGISLLHNGVSGLALPFRFPEVEPLVVLWPITTAKKEHETEDRDEENA